MHRAVIAGLMLILTATTAAAQPQRVGPRPAAPPATGQRVNVTDGDMVVADNRARVRFVRRTDATVRAIYNSGEHWLVLLVDAATPDGRVPDGGVDSTYTFNDLSGEWPLGERWEGSAVVEDYSLLADAGSMAQGTGLLTPSGLIQLLNRMGGDTFRDSAAASALTYSRWGRGGGNNTPFATAEAQQIAAASRNVQPRQGAVTGGGIVSVINGVPVTSESGAANPAMTPGTAPVRVGGNIRSPRRVVDAPAVLPADAAQANIRGVVILEIVIGPDGAVREAKVLRSIPLLDQAALDAARKWRYEPTLLNGVPVPVILTATVNFQ
jgi:TonB family protein